MLKHCEYDKIKLLHELSSLLWFIKQHAQSDAKNASDKECVELLDALAQDLEKHITKLQGSLHSKC